MDLSDVVGREPVTPWGGTSKIPWHEPEFSERMLREHLDQSHGAASRPFALIDQQVAWLHQHLWSRAPQHILDLGCGPGLYSQRLAGLGHRCVGIDFSPASIRYAREQDPADVDYRLGDLRQGEYGRDFSAALLLFGEFNAFPESEAAAILGFTAESLTSEGKLILEVHTDDYVRTIGKRSPNWFSSEQSVFCDVPHVCLHESHWHETERASTDRYYIIEHGLDRPVEYISTHQAYTEDEYRGLLEGAGFTQFERYPALSGRWDPNQTGLFVLVAGF